MDINKDIDKDKNNKSEPEKETNNPPKKESDSIFDEYKEIFYLLKKWGKFLLENIEMILLFFGTIDDYDNKITVQNNKYKKAYQKEIDNFEIEKQKIIKEKNETIKKIHEKKNNSIKESNEKCNKILSYLETIKNDKAKLLEFLNKKDLF